MKDNILFKCMPERPGNRRMPHKIMLVMKLTAVLLFVAALHVSAKSFSQQVTLSSKNAGLASILREIEQQTGYQFFYKESLLEKANRISIRVKNAPLAEVLDRCFAGQPFTYTMIDKIIVVKAADAAAVKPPGEITGKVLNERGEVMIGVSVFIANTNQGTVTDENGRFRLTVDDPENTILEFRFIGYESQTVSAGKQTNIQVVLKESARKLDELAVVGFGTQRKVNLTGAVATVNGDVFEGRPVTSTSAGLQGALPGVTIQSASGQPGRPALSIAIRGVNTLNSSNSPLILIDGVMGGNHEMLNPDDIESISVLKDAASAAIYGARAANGVILITTKKGRIGDQLSLNYAGYAGFQQPTRLPELVNGREFMELHNEARENAGLAAVYLNDAFDAYDAGNDPNNYSNTDWINEIYKSSAFQHSHTLNLSGSSGKTGYYLSYGRLDQDGLIVGDSYNAARNNLRVRVNTEVFNRLKLDANISYMDLKRLDNALSGTAGVFRLAQRISPLVPVKWQTPASGGGWEETPYYAYGSVANPVNVGYNSGYNRFHSRNPAGNFSATLKLVEGLNISGQYAFTSVMDQTKEFNNAMLRYRPDGSDDPANASMRNNISRNNRDDLTQTFISLLTYDKDFGGHHLRALAGYSQEWGFTSWLGAARRNILMDGVEQIDLGTEDISNSGTESHWALRSYFGRLNYDYKERYLFEANLRRDGTSRFSPRNRWGTFPSFSAGWKLSEEPFLRFIKPVVDLAKIRVSYGELGNQNVGAGDLYPYLTGITRVQNPYPMGGLETVGFSQGSLGNEELVWESIEMTNIGIDLQLLRNRLSLTADWYVKNNKNALLKPVYPSLIGFTSAAALPLVNMGKVQSRGWELSAGWRDQAGSLQYGVNFNLSDVTNKVIALGKSAASLGEALIREGDPLNAFFGYQTDGLAQVSDFGGYDQNTGRYTDPGFPTISSYTAITQPGDLKYRDISGPDGKPDGIIDSHDRTIIGNPYPRYTYALRGDLAWKGFDFSFFLQGVGQVDGYLKEEAIHAFINDYSVPQKIHTDRWTPDNTNAAYPRLFYGQTHNREFADYWIQDASYLRLKNIQLGYTLPVHLTRRANIDRMRVYASADNLFTRSDYFYAYDPEVRSTSGDAYPQVKTIILGMTITFK